MNHALEDRVAELLAAQDLHGAATEALRGYGPEILGYLANLVRDLDEAREVFSMFSEDLWRGLPSFRRDSALRTWAYRLALHAALRHKREPYRKRKTRLDTAGLAELVAQVKSSTALHRKETSKAWLAAMRLGLSTEEHTLLVLRVDRAMGWDEIATVLSSDDRPAGAAALRLRFHRLKDKLKSRRA